MAAKTWETDFRYPAIEASLPLLEESSGGSAVGADSVLHDDIFKIPKSFCVPVTARPAVGFTPGKAMLLFLLVGFALLGLSVWVMSFASDDQVGGKSWGVLLLAIISMLAGMMCFFIPSLFNRQLVAWFLGERGRKLMDRASGSVTLTGELGDGDLNHQSISIDGDDHVLVLMDHANGRLLIEGIGARYQIRSEDVLSVQPFVFTNYLGAQVRCQINGQAELLFAIAKSSILFEITRQLPFLFFLRKRIGNPLFTETVEALGVGDPNAKV